MQPFKHLFLQHGSRPLSALLVLSLLTGLTGCGEPAGDTKQPEASSTANSSGQTYTAPEMAVSVFHADQAEGNESVQLDLSATAYGYIAVSATTPERLKFQTLCGEYTYTYDMANDGTVSYFPLQCGDGDYQFRVMKNVTGTKYAVLYDTHASVTLADSFQPFIRPNDYVSYTADSACVKQAQALAQGASTALDVVSAVYDYVCETVTYDHDKAQNVQTGYMPNIDETLSSGKGICFDYASLVAAMLRSQGIPTKVIFGYVSPNDLYHAWNMFYTEETGWVTVDYQVTGNSWQRLDLTFSANGSDDTFIGNGENYTDVYIY